MQDFNFPLVVDGVTFILTLNECNDGSAFVGDMTKDGEPCSFDDIVEFMAHAWVTDVETMEACLNSQLNERVAQERAA